MHDLSFDYFQSPPDGAACGAQALARRLDREVALRWMSVRERHRSRLQPAFIERGPIVYDSCLRLLLRPLLARISPDVQSYPRVPGGLARSRLLWHGGQRSRERWLTLALCGLDDVPLGMLVIVVQENLERFEVSRRPRVFALGCMGIDAVRAELARRFAPGIDNESQRVIAAQLTGAAPI